MLYYNKVIQIKGARMLRIQIYRLLLLFGVFLSYGNPPTRAATFFI